jgi:hypothetical protein
VKGKKAPRHLRAATRRWWEQVYGDYQLESHHELLLTACGECLDRISEAREAIAADGLFLNGNGRNKKAHPGAAVECAQKILLARLLRELNLDIDAPAEARLPRPQGRYD